MFSEVVKWPNFICCSCILYCNMCSSCVIAFAVSGLSLQLCLLSHQRSVSMHLTQTPATGYIDSSAGRCCMMFFLHKQLSYTLWPPAWASSSLRPDSYSTTVVRTHTHTHTHTHAHAHTVVMWTEQITTHLTQNQWQTFHINSFCWDILCDVRPLKARIFGIWITLQPNMIQLN